MSLEGMTWFPTWPSRRVEPLFLSNMEKVKKRAQDTSISMKHQATITIKAKVKQIAGLEAGELIVARVDGSGSVVLERDEDVLERLLGSMTGVLEPEILEQLRNKWD